MKEVFCGVLRYVHSIGRALKSERSWLGGNIMVCLRSQAKGKKVSNAPQGLSILLQDSFFKYADSPPSPFPPIPHRTPPPVLWQAPPHVRSGLGSDQYHRQLKPANNETVVEVHMVLGNVPVSLLTRTLHSVHPIADVLRVSVLDNVNVSALCRIQGWAEASPQVCQKVLVYGLVCSETSDSPAAQGNPNTGRCFHGVCSMVLL